MAIAAIMTSQEDNNKDDHHHHQPDHDYDHDMVMPGFRFHPTEEELIEFYLRRKVEGKRFNVELITFLDLYRYDPWELPGIFFFGCLSVSLSWISTLLQFLSLSLSLLSEVICEHMNWF